MFDSARFELFVALRYLRAKRKQAVISIISAISVVGVAAGVTALVIALAITNGVRGTLQRTIVGVTAHVSILAKKSDEGIPNWREVVEKALKLPYVQSAAPTLYGTVYFAGPQQNGGANLKGVDPASPVHRANLQRNLKQGSIEGLHRSGVPGIILGSQLALATGMMLDSQVTVVTLDMTPYGMRPSTFPFRVVGIFESGFYEIDRQFAFTTMANVQRVLSLGDVANAVELRVEPVEKSQEVARKAESLLGPALSALSWEEQNKGMLSALRTERLVTTITIGLILLVAALNILTSQVMMVMEKHRDIALLVSMGARREQIRRIFLWQGVLIGVTGTLIGLVCGYGFSYLANARRLIPLDATVYSMSFVPFEPRWWDAGWIGAGAIAISLLATLYPARNASGILPAEALRYE
jgi:lipoprotein-releasing system permease protein